ncbi:GntR family transcriptional regulator [Marinivivus vitaminiproducens]|uniref:GntR family transcriptional regulator n=1 Tax=Marinivivus vitaminiproducens TaxID=3035935 RepID=UPI002799CE05|nr:GntR family transcriptional regulator [Geminicoccaceae bacterium SCSIO 64248]
MSRGIETLARSRAPAQDDTGAPTGGSDPFTPIPRRSLSERAYQEIRTALMRSRLKPGTKLLLRPLSTSLGISATPVREALLRLVSEHGLEMDERGTAFVPVLDRSTLMQIRALRVELEGRSAESACSRATEEDIAHLASIHEAMDASLESADFARAIEMNERFHFALCRLGAMPILFQIVETLWMRCGPILAHLYDNGPIPFDVHPHIRICEALRRRDRAAMRPLIEEDILRGGDGLLAFVDMDAQDDRSGDPGER